MLVLSRRPGERVLFPHQDISVQVLACKGSTVRLGIEAPSEVTIVREEVASEPVPASARAEKEREFRHNLRGRMNTLAMALHVAEKQLQAGLTADCSRTLQETQQFLEAWQDNQVRAQASTESQKPLEALLVEDNPNEEALLSSYLRLNGFSVETVHDGYEALEFLAGHQRPDFVLLDMRLPRFDGPATISAIRQNPAFKGLRIFAVTGSTGPEFANARANVDGWFQKPLNPQRIVDAMKTAAARVN